MREKIKTFIWDLDNTLYKFNDTQIYEWNKATSNYALQNGVDDLPFEEAIKIAEKGWLEHRNSGHFFEKNYDLCPQTMHVGVNKSLPETMVTPCLDTPDLMEEMRHHHHVILTFAISDWAHRVLDHTGLSDFFQPDFILGAEHYNFEDKAHSPRGILTALDKIGGNADEVLFVEDTLPNLITAKQHTGVNTAYLHHNRPINDSEMGDIDICVQDTPELLRWFKEIPST